MRLLILITLIGFITAVVIDEISSSESWLSESELVHVLERQQLPYDIKDQEFSAEVLPGCRPTTVSLCGGVTYTTTLELPVTVTVTNTRILTGGVQVTQSVYEAPTVTVTQSATVTKQLTYMSVVTRYTSPPDADHTNPVRAAMKAKTEEGDDSCIYVGDATGGYDVLTIVADLLSQVLHLMQYYLDKFETADPNQAATAQAFIAAVKLTLHIRGIGCGVFDNTDPIVGFPGVPDKDVEASKDVLKQILDFDPANKSNPLAELRDTVLAVFNQMGIHDFDEIGSILKDPELIKEAASFAGLPTDSDPIRNDGDRQLREVLHLVGLPGLSNFRSLLHRFFKAAGENNFSDNIDDLIAAFKNTPYKGTLARMDTTNFNDYVETKPLYASYNSTLLRQNAASLDPRNTKEQYDKVLDQIANMIVKNNGSVADLVPSFVNLYFRLFSK